MGSRIIQRLELALRVKKPTPGEVLEQVSTRGVLRGPVDFVFSAWRLYVEYAAQVDRRDLSAHRGGKEDASKLPRRGEDVANGGAEAGQEKLAALYKAVAEGTHRLEGGKLFAPDGTWMYTRENLVPRVLIHSVSASTRFPDLLKLPHERLELLQLGWRASDEGSNKGRPVMGTTQPWQVFAWATVRYGEIYIRIASVNLTREGVSVTVHLKANSWRQKRSKAEAVDLVISHLRSGERAPLLTMWLGDGKARWRRIGREVAISTKEPQRLGRTLGEYEAIVAKGREAFVRLMEVAGHTAHCWSC